MTLLREIAGELIGMFMADARLTLAILALVALVAGLILALGVDPLLAGGALLVGCHLILVEAALREARRRRPDQ
jgi:Flp pilus assembly protein TadB